MYHTSTSIQSHSLPLEPLHEKEEDKRESDVVQLLEVEVWNLVFRAHACTCTQCVLHLIVCACVNLGTLMALVVARVKTLGNVIVCASSQSNLLSILYMSILVEVNYYGTGILYAFTCTCDVLTFIMCAVAAFFFIVLAKQ